MRVLWFYISVPGKYHTDENYVTAGWQDSLEAIVRGIPDVELIVAFRGKGTEKIVDGVKYLPMDIKFNLYEKVKANFTWSVECEKVVKESVRIVEKYQPDVIHIFGTEWPFGLIAEKTNVPIVVHIQGAAGPYYNAKYSPGYNFATYLFAMRGNLARYIFYGFQSLKQRTRVKMEKRIFCCVENYMGRTKWDKAISSVCHPNCRYFYVNEALRPSFQQQSSTQWKLPDKGMPIVLTTIGCGTLYKGADMLLKTAKLLKQLGVKFSWNLVGVMPNELKKLVEYKEKCHFENLDIHLRGPIKPDELSHLLCSSTLYVHVSYIDNSPNSLCEAQILGVPIISTNVGGISSLVEDGMTGILVPANDPYRMAYEVIELINDRSRMESLSQQGREAALLRHNPESIKKGLLDCYTTLINSK